MGFSNEQPNRPTLNSRESIEEGVQEFSSTPNPNYDQSVEMLEMTESQKQFLKTERVKERFFEKLRYEMDPKILFTFPKSERKIALDVYKSIVAKRLEGVGEIRKFLLEALQKNPEREYEEIKDQVVLVGERYNIPKEILLERFAPVFERYKERREIMSRKEGYEEIRDELEYLGIECDLIKKISLDLFFIFAHTLDIDFSKPENKSRNNPGKGGYWPYDMGGIYAHGVDGKEMTKGHEEQHAIYNLEHGGINPNEKISPALALVLEEVKNGVFNSFRFGKDTTFSQFLNTPEIYTQHYRELSPESKKNYREIMEEAVDILKDFLDIPEEEKQRITTVLDHIPIKEWGKEKKKILSQIQSGKETNHWYKKIPKRKLGDRYYDIETPLGKAKNEMLAFFRGGEKDGNTHGILYLYPEFSDHLSPKAKEEYKKRVRRGGNVLESLSGILDKEVIIGMLSGVPLDKWEKVAERIFEDKKRERRDEMVKKALFKTEKQNSL